MKKSIGIALGISMTLAGTERICGMERLFAAMGLGGKAVVEETFTDRWNRLLAKQAYATLSEELYAALDNVSDSAKRFQTHQWVTEKLGTGLDPFLLYMDARTVFGSQPVDHRVYPPAFRNLMLCVVLTEVAQGVAQSFGYESSPGRGIPDLAARFKHKFRAQHGTGTLNRGIRGEVEFETVKGEAVKLLQGLLESDEAITALPLPHWVLRTSCGWSLGWGITWSTLTESELATRKTPAFMAALVAATKIVLADRMKVLAAIKSWEEFLGFDAMDGKDSKGDGKRADEDGGKEEEE